MASAEPGGSKPAARPRQWWLVFGLGMSGVFAAAIVAAIGSLIFVFGHFSVPSASNEPTLQVGDNFLALCYRADCRFRLLPLLRNIRFAEPQLGDMAVFRKADDPSVIYVKRIVGMPGDEVQMQAGVLFLNGKAVTDIRIADFVETAHGTAPHAVPQFVETLPNGVRHLVIRHFPENNLADTPVFKVPPGHYFVIGDNIDNSSDSRDPNGGVGFVPRENMVARAVRITVSVNSLQRAFSPIDPPLSPAD